MRHFVVICGVLFFLSACQSTGQSNQNATQSSEEATTEQTASHETLYCRNVRDTNSRMLRRECRTRSQVESDQQESERNSSTQAQGL